MISKETKNHAQYHYESSLHQAWGGLKFDRRRLETTDRQELRIHHPGVLNHDQGPDFLNAEIQIGKQRHYGHVELHLAADDWKRHGHHMDPHYNAVMLHVYLVQGKSAALRADGSAIPELCLVDRIHPVAAGLQHTTLPCSGMGRHHLPASPDDWLDALGIERIHQKACLMRERLASLQYDWNQVLWEEMATALGGPVNGLHFRQLATQGHWGLVRKYVHSLECIEALLFGICGMLDGNPVDDHQGLLKMNWEFLRQKHRLRPVPIPFKFHRMHPAGFPVLRIAQLAMIAVAFRPLCELLEAGGMHRFASEWTASSDYWGLRYDFGNTLNAKRMDFGSDCRQRVVLNALAPLSLLFLESGGRELETDDFGLVLDLLREMRPENNKITRKFTPLGIRPQNALAAQGMVGLYKGHCTAFRCLECVVGKGALGIASK